MDAVYGLAQKVFTIHISRASAGQASRYDAFTDAFKEQADLRVDNDGNLLNFQERLVCGLEERLISEKKR